MNFEFSHIQIALNPPPFPFKKIDHAQLEGRGTLKVIDNYIQSVRFATYVKYRLLHAKSAIMSECGARGYILSLFAWNKVFKARLSCHLIVPHVYIATLFENDESEKRA